MRSDNIPHSGAKMNCMNEKLAISQSNGPTLGINRVLLGIDWQQRHDHAKPQQIHEDCQKNDEKRTGA